MLLAPPKIRATRDILTSMCYIKKTDTFEIKRGDGVNLKIGKFETNFKDLRARLLFVFFSSFLFCHNVRIDIGHLLEEGILFVKHSRRIESSLDRDTWPSRSLGNKYCQEYRGRTKQPLFSFLRVISLSLSFPLVYNKYSSLSSFFSTSFGREAMHFSGV